MPPAAPARRAATRLWATRGEPGDLNRSPKEGVAFMPRPAPPPGDLPADTGEATARRAQVRWGWGGSNISAMYSREERRARKEFLATIVRGRGTAR